MPCTSRTARAARAVAAVCRPPSLMLALVSGALLTGLWLLGAAPASAEDGSPDTGTLRSDRPALASLTGASPADDRAEGHDASGAPSNGSSGSQPLDGVLSEGVSAGNVVPGEVSAPVSATLGTVHHRLERGAQRTADVLPEATRSVQGVGGQAHRVVGELDPRDSGGLLSPDSPETEAGPPAPDENAQGRPSSGRERARGDDSPEDASSGRGPDHTRGPAPATTGPVPEASAPEEEGSASNGADAPAPSVGQLGTGSTATTGGGTPAPAVAGYLTTDPAAAPAADGVLLDSRAPRAVPGGPSDTPTASPD